MPSAGLPAQRWQQPVAGAGG